MTSASAKISVIKAELDGVVFNKNIVLSLEKMQNLVETMAENEKSAEFQNLLRGFIRMWNDEFWPKDDLISPIPDELFELHGFPEERSKHA